MCTKQKLPYLFKKNPNALKEVEKLNLRTEIVSKTCPSTIPFPSDPSVPPAAGQKEKKTSKKRK